MSQESPLFESAQQSPAAQAYLVAALYKFVRLEDYLELREPLRAFCLEQGIKGTLLLAREGINGTVSGSPGAIDALLKHLRADARLSDLSHKTAWHASQPFYRMKVRLKKEIVTMGVEDIDPNQQVGTYVAPEDWNALIRQPDVLLLDTRNHYEVLLGSFAGAVDPHTDSFREFPHYVSQYLRPQQHKKVAMFCTGGIRCEKASSYMKQQGFDEVYHLQGGILKYLEEVPAQESLWQGECFVFDNRVSVNHQLQKGSYELCHGCRHPISEADQQSIYYVPGVSCPNCHADLPEKTRARAQARQRQMRLAKARKQIHLGSQ